MFKSCLLSVLIIFAGLSSSVYSAVVIENGNGVSNAYARLIQAEHQLLKSELAVAARKSANFENLLAGGHATWLENRGQKLVVDILKAELAAYKEFESQAMATMTDGNIKLESKFGSVKTDSAEARLATIQELQQELTTLRQAEAKLAHVAATLPASDPWTEGYRLRHAVAVDEADVVAAKIVLVERLNDLRDETRQTSKLATWKRPLKDSSSMKLMITQAELQIQLSQHHLLNETRRLTGLQELVSQGMTTERSIIEAKKKVTEINELLKEQQGNLSFLKKDLDDSPSTDQFYTSIPKSSPVPPANSSVRQSLLNQFELGQASYLRHEAMLKGEMYREVLGRLEQAVGLQQNQTKYDSTSAEFSNVLIRGQQRELEQYRWKIKKTDIQRDLADAEIALLKQSDGSLSKNVNMLVSTGKSSGSTLTLPSRFLSSDPFGLQTTYSAFTFNSPVFRARRPVSSSTRADLSSVFRPVINRDALSFYRGFQSSRYGGFSRVHSFGTFGSGFRSLPGPSSVGVSPFRSNSHFHSFGRNSQIFRSSGLGGRYGR